jgi:hypothetical protein
MVARRRGDPCGVRKVRAPQRRVAGNTRPPRGEDQRHSDDVATGSGRSRSETRQALPGARPNRRAMPGPPGAGALPSPRVGRMSRRATGGPRWMAIAAAPSVPRHRTRLTGRLAGRIEAKDLVPLREVRDPASVDPERDWPHGTRLYRAVRVTRRSRSFPPGPSIRRASGSRLGLADQSSSGRKMWSAVQALQIGVAASRSPSGSGSRRSGNRHSTS